MNQLVAEGNTPLSADQLRELVTDQRLHLDAIDFDGQVQYLPDGHLRAESLQGGKDSGKWYITPEDQLCMKFNLWYYGDLKCYKLVKEKEQYIFFTTNGARYYTGTSSAENQKNTVDQNRRKVPWSKKTAGNNPLLPDFPRQKNSKPCNVLPVIVQAAILPVLTWKAPS